MALLQTDAPWIDPIFDELARSPESESMIAILDEYSRQYAISARAMVTFWVLAGQADRAMEMAWQLVDDPNFFEVELLYLDEFQILRQHEDFPRLLDELGLSQYWRDVGCQWDNNAGQCKTS